VVRRQLSVCLAVSGEVTCF